MFSLFRRNTFLGRTDQYLTTALAGLAVIDPMRDYFSQHMRDDTVTRMNRYYKHWRFYNRKHYTVEMRDGERKMVVNYCRAIVDKSADWLMAKGFDIEAPEGNEAIAEILAQVWRANNPLLTGWRLAQVGGVTGDAFLILTVPWLDPYGRVIPFNQQGIRIQVVNSSYVHPKFASSEDHTITRCMIQYPVERSRYASILGSNADRDLAMYSQYIDVNEIREFIDDREIPNTRRPNPFGIVPVVHIQNLPHPGFFGLSDIDDIIDINEDFNEVQESIRKIIKYHAEPTTLIFGAKAGDLVRGAGKVWSGLPENARVETLRLDANLAEATSFRDNLKLAIHELSGTPESSLGKVQAISNTSDAALQTAYLPLIEKTMRKRITYGSGIVEANRILLMILRNYFRVPVDRIAGNPMRMYETSVSWPSPLPSDEQALVGILSQEMQSNLESEAGALRRLHRANRTTKAVEIVADKREKLLRDRESGIAAMGGIPNLAANSVGSLGMIDGVQEAFAVADQAIDGVVRKQKEIEAQNQAASEGGEPGGGEE